jgi:Ser/Thr protein kinase RdoA (MazF antagonist)
MQPFELLTPIGQSRRLRAVACAALQEYAITVRRLSLLTVDTNTIFRVDAATGDRYALRISTPGEHSLNDNLIELAWLTALARDTTLKVVIPVANQRGDYLTQVALPTVPETRRCVLFRWLPGRPLATQVSPAHTDTLGTIMAALHDHAATVQLPPSLTPMTWHTVFYYHHEPVVIDDPAYAALFSTARRAVIHEVATAAEQVLQSLAQSTTERILLHGDLHPYNVHVAHGRLYILDFEDVLFGYPVQDIAITFAAFRHYPDCERLQSAFQAGYSRRRPWPVQSPTQLTALIAACDLMMVNYAAQAEAEPEAAVARICSCLMVAQSLLYNKE